jgi:Secretion system C-terminal sorting domain
LWDEGSTHQMKVIDTIGWHSVEVQSSHCGNDQDSIYADLIFTPMVDLGNDTIINMAFNLTLDAGKQAVSYLWSNGDTTQTISVDNPGTYWVEVSNYCDTIRDSLTSTKNIGVFETDPFSAVGIVPNPSTGLFEVVSHASPILHLTLLNELGQKVNVSSISNSLYSLKNVKPGIYIVQVKLQEGMIRRKLIIN